MSSLAPLVEGNLKENVAERPVDKPVFLEEIDLSKHAEPPKLQNLKPQPSLHGGPSAKSKRSDRAKARNVARSRGAPS